MKVKNKISNRMAGLKFIRQKLYPAVIGILVAFILLSLVLQQFSWLFSALLGTAFSWLILNNQMKSQVIILAKKHRGAFFPSYVMRLVYYSLPILLSLKISFLSFFVTLSFLFIFQASFIILTFVRSYYKHKRRFGGINPV